MQTVDLGIQWLMGILQRCIFFILLSHFTTLQQLCLLPLLLVPLLPTIPHRYIVLDSLQKRGGLQGMSTKHDITSYKTRYKPSYQDWTRQPSKGRRVPRTKSQQHPLLPVLADLNLLLLVAEWSLCNGIWARQQGCILMTNARNVTKIH